MPPAINPFPALRTVALRPRPAVVRRGRVVVGVTRRAFADQRSKDVPDSDGQAVGPNMQQAEHVSEEAAKMAKIQGGKGPDIEGQGTPVQDILKDEQDTRKNAPQVMKEDAQAGNTTKPQTRAFSTYARRSVEVDSSASTSASEIEQAFAANAAADYTAASATAAAADVEPQGHKFALPPIPLPRELVKDHRYDPVVTQVTNLLMKDGKKSVAQRNMSVLLNILRTSPAPTYNPSRPLLPGAPPASHLPLNPTLYLTLAVDSVAPLLRIRSQRGAAGGGVALQIPVPLGLRQRRRTAFMWILDAAVKRKSKGSGNDMFAQKVAEEIIAIVEGRSAVWDKRTGVHKLATTARANLNYSMRGRR